MIIVTVRRSVIVVAASITSITISLIRHTGKKTKYQQQPQVIIRTTKSSQYSSRKLRHYNRKIHDEYDLTCRDKPVNPAPFHHGRNPAPNPRKTEPLQRTRCGGAQRQGSDGGGACVAFTEELLGADMA